MPDTVLIDELHLSLSRPADLPEEQVEAMRRALASNEFLARLRRALQTAVESVPELARLQLSMTR